jgi:2-oxoglutarate ferredoxin oxidoreductase subunit alpha
MADFVYLAFELAFRYRNPAMIMADGAIGQMMEKVVLPPFKPRRTEAEIIRECPWATTGRVGMRKPNIITSLELRSEEMEVINLRIQAKYREIEEKEVRYEKFMLDDAEYAIVAFGSAARIAKKSIEIARAQGLKVGLLRPITLWPFPSREVARLSQKVKGILSLEINAGQMVEDIMLAAGGNAPVRHFGRLGGIIPDPDEVAEALRNMF